MNTRFTTTCLVLLTAMVAAAPAWAQDDGEDVPIDRFARWGIGVGWAPVAENYSLLGFEAVAAVPFTREPGVALAMSMDAGIYANLLGGSGEDEVQAGDYASVSEWRLGLGGGIAGVWGEEGLAQLTVGPVVSETTVEYANSGATDERSLADIEVSFRMIYKDNLLWGIRGGPNIGGTFFGAYAF